MYNIQYLLAVIENVKRQLKDVKQRGTKVQQLEVFKHLISLYAELNRLIEAKNSPNTPPHPQDTPPKHSA